jgi:hypothetical protein
MTSDNKLKGSLQEQSQKRKNLPIVRNEDVEFSTEKADFDDLEALQRADTADNRQINNP